MRRRALLQLGGPRAQFRGLGESGRGLAIGARRKKEMPLQVHFLSRYRPPIPPLGCLFSFFLSFEQVLWHKHFERVGGSCLFTGAGRPRARRTGSGTSWRRASTLRVAQKASARRRYGGGGGRRPTADGRRPTADGRRQTAYGIRPTARLGARARARARVARHASLREGARQP